MTYTPRTGRRCACRPGLERDNCPRCEGAGWVIDFARIHRARRARNEVDRLRALCDWLEAEEIEHDDN
jgi:hypothetical protein